jgi:hypothetical protein
MGENNANPFAAYDIAVRIKECVLERLATTTDGEPDRACVIVGEMADDECECGQLTVAMETNFEAVNTNTPRSTTETPGRRECGPPNFVVNYTITILRCAPSGTNTAPPTCDELESSARSATEDAWAVRAGVICCLSAAIKDKLPNGTRLYRDFVVGVQTWVGPRGGCVGSALPVSVTIDNGCYPCDMS